MRKIYLREWISILSLWSQCENETWLQINFKRSRGKCLELASFRESFYFWDKTSIQASSLTQGKERCKLNVIIPYYNLLCNMLLYNLLYNTLLFSCPVMSDSLWSHGLQCTRPPCPSPSPSLPEFMLIASVIPSRHSILWCPLLLPLIFPGIREMKICVSHHKFQI